MTVSLYKLGVLPCTPPSLVSCPADRQFSSTRHSCGCVGEPLVHATLSAWHHSGRMHAAWRPRTKHKLLPLPGFLPAWERGRTGVAWSELLQGLIPSDLNDGRGGTFSRKVFFSNKAARWQCKNTARAYTVLRRRVGSPPPGTPKPKTVTQSLSPVPIKPVKPLQTHQPCATPTTSSKPLALSRKTEISPQPGGRQKKVGGAHVRRAGWGLGNTAPVLIIGVWAHHNFSVYQAVCDMTLTNNCTSKQQLNLRTQQPQGHGEVALPPASNTFRSH